MGTTDTSLCETEIRAVLPHWRVGPVLFTRPIGGTANASKIVVTRSGQFVLKRRNPRYCKSGQPEYDHHVLHHLWRAGLPVPKVLRTEGESRWVEHEGSLYELYGYIDGQVHPAANDAQMAEAGRLLAQFHEATSALQPPGEKHFGRFWDPTEAIRLVGLFLDRIGVGDTGTSRMPGDEIAGVLADLRDRCETVREEVPDEVYWDLPSPIIHGDWHPWNIRWQGDKIVGIFDFDWVDRQPRLVDIADGILYFCPIRAADTETPDIRELTRAFEPDRDRIGVFLQAYDKLRPLTDRELKLLPSFATIRWIYSRLDAADRKIPEPEQIEFIIREVTVPLKWLDGHTEFFTRRWRT